MWPIEMQSQSGFWFTGCLLLRLGCSAAAGVRLSENLDGCSWVSTPAGGSGLSLFVANETRGGASAAVQVNYFPLAPVSRLITQRRDDGCALINMQPWRNGECLGVKTWSKQDWVFGIEASGIDFCILTWEQKIFWAANLNPETKRFFILSFSRPFFLHSTETYIINKCIH